VIEQQQLFDELSTTGLPHRRDLRRLVRNILKNDHDVEDVLQDVHLAALTFLGTGGVIDDTQKWLRRAARNRAVDMLRQRRPTVALEDVTLTSPSPEDIAIANEVAR
jgi:DNA-directed RNA polymerase specialized sigma24 family protein